MEEEMQYKVPLGFAYAIKYDKKSNGLLLVDGNNFIMDYEEMQNMVFGLIKYLEFTKPSDIIVHNHQLMAELERDTLEATPSTRKPLKGYVYIVRQVDFRNHIRYRYNKFKNGWRSSLTESEIEEKIDNIQDEYDIPVEILRAYKVDDIGRFHYRLRQWIGTRKTINNWYVIPDDKIECLLTNKLPTNLLCYIESIYV